MHLTDDFLYLPDAALVAMKIAPSDVADAIESALVAKAEGRLHTAPKSVVLPGDGRYMMSTLAVGDEGLTVLKQVTVSPGNAARGLPAINGAIMVLDAETGLLRALIGANWVTAVRTAGLSAVAARRLADPNASSIAFVGSGVQAHSHLEAFRHMFPLKEVRVFGRGRANVEALCETARDLGLAAAAATTAEEALSGADLVVTSVTLDYTIKPFLDARWLKKGAFAAITDLCIPWHDAHMPAFGTIVVDDRAQEAASEKPMVAPDLIDADLTELVTGPAHIRQTAKPSAFVFRGLALGDYAAAALAVRRAEATGAGRRIDA